MRPLEDQLTVHQLKRQIAELFGVDGNGLLRRAICTRLSSEFKYDDGLFDSELSVFRLRQTLAFLYVSLAF